MCTFPCLPTTLKSIFSLLGFKDKTKFLTEIWEGLQKPSPTQRISFRKISPLLCLENRDMGDVLKRKFTGKVHNE